MNARHVVLAMLGLVASHAPAPAAWLPSFSLSYSAWDATDVVVATEGDVTDGKFKVLETWKGGVKAGADLTVPELATLASDKTRTVLTGWGGGRPDQPPVRVTGARVVLFLKAPTAAGGPWRPTADEHPYYDWSRTPRDWWRPPAVTFSGRSTVTAMRTSAVWVEGAKTYAFAQMGNPGPSVLVELRDTPEAKLKADAVAVFRAQADVARAGAVADPARRARALAPHVDAELVQARRLAFGGLAECGPAGVPVLRAMLADDGLLAHHDAVIEAMGDAGAAAVGPDLLAVVEADTAVFRRAGPGLKTGWRTGGEPVPPEHRRLLSVEVRLAAALRTLRRLEYAGCAPTVTRLRDVWRSLPQLNHPGRPDPVNDECDAVLRAVAGK